MPKKSKYKPAPSNYYDMKNSVDKSKKVKHSEVFGKPKVSNAKGTNNSTPKKTKKKTDKKKSSY
jgi:hypothetical protein